MDTDVLNSDLLKLIECVRHIVEKNMLEAREIFGEDGGTLASELECL